MLPDGKMLWAWMLAAALAFANLAMGEGGAVLLAEEGAPKAVLVLPSDAGRVERSAANLLQHFVKQMSGAELPLQVAAERTMWHQVELAHEGMNFVLVGAEELAGQLGIEKGDIGPGGLRIKTFANGVALLGGPERVEGELGSDDGGVRHAAIELLRRLGCEYLWPGESGLVVPRQETLAVGPLDYSYTPPLRRRGVRWGRNIGDRTWFDRPLEQIGMTPEEWLEGHRRAIGEQPPVSWSEWQRLGGYIPTAFGHAGSGLRAECAERLLEEEPEWFAMQAHGTRDQSGERRWRLCKSNPELIEYVANDIIRRANENPNLEIVSLFPNDGGSNAGFCLCDACKALDPPEGQPINLFAVGEPTRPDSPRRRQMRIEHVSLTDRLVHFWNAVAERVTAVHPNLLFGIAAYGVYSAPPLRNRVHPNLVICYVPSTTDGWKGWQAMGAQRLFWRPNILITGFRDGKLRSYVGNLSEAMRYFVEAGLVQTEINTIRHWWGTEGINYYAAARLVWNPYLTTEQIIAEYAQRGFGAGAEHVERYFLRAEELTEQGVYRTFGIVSRHGPLTQEGAEHYRYTPEVMAELRALLNQAEQAAADDAEVVRRIEFLRLGLNYTELQERLAWKTWRARQGEEWDRELGRRLIDLNCILTRHIPLRHNLVVNTVYQTGRSATFAQFAPIRGRTWEPSDPALLERADDPRYGLTGQEQSLEEMLEAFGL